MATLPDAIARIQVLVRALGGIRGAPNEPPEKLNRFPFAVAFAGRGTWAGGSPAGEKRGLHTIIVELHVARKDLPRDVAAAMGYTESIPNTILNDPTLNGNVDAVNEIRYTFGPLGWGTAETLGFQFEIDVKQRSAIT